MYLVSLIYATNEANATVTQVTITNELISRIINSIINANTLKKRLSRNTGKWKPSAHGSKGTLQCFVILLWTKRTIAHTMDEHKRNTRFSGCPKLEKKYPLATPHAMIANQIKKILILNIFFLLAKIIIHKLPCYFNIIFLSITKYFSWIIHTKH